MDKKKFFFILIFLVAVFFRFQNINWDNNFHLHPDERFLTMVGTAMSLPASIDGYFSPATSSLNPTNIGYPFFVYGIFPLVLNKIIAVFLNNDTYNAFAIQGRILSGFFDLVTLLFVYKIVKLFEIRYRLPSAIKLYAIFFYAISVYPIQISHFFAVDTFLSAFLIIGLYYCLRFFYQEKTILLLVSSVAMGFALATKISGLYMLPLIMMLLFANMLRKKRFIDLVLYTSLFLLVTYTVVRFVNPYYFETGDFLDVMFNKQFVQNITELKNMSSGSIWYPPAVQWYSKTPVLFSLFNLAWLGLGIPYFLAVIYGSFYLLKKTKKGEFHFIMISMLLWTYGYFLYTSVQFVKSLRYLIFLFPFFSIYAAFGTHRFFQIVHKKIRKQYILVLYIVCIVLYMTWPVVFSSIYVQKHTRVLASEWIYEHIKDRSVILSEYWDDALPLPIESTYNKTFDIRSIAVFDLDTDEKWRELDAQLRMADYYILSSNRGWGSIPTVPDKYPRMSRFYKNLFEGKTEYKLVKKIVPWYQTCFPFHPNSWINNWMEEVFTVYDHPSVFIFQRR